MDLQLERAWAAGPRAAVMCWGGVGRWLGPGNAAPLTNRPHRPTAKPDHTVLSFGTGPLCGLGVGDTVHVPPLLRRKPMPSLFSRS